MIQDSAPWPRTYVMCFPGAHAAARWSVCCRVAGSLVILRWCFNRQPGDQDVQAPSQQPFSVASSGYVACEYTFLVRTRVAVTAITCSTACFTIALGTDAAAEHSVQLIRCQATGPRRQLMGH